MLRSVGVDQRQRRWSCGRSDELSGILYLNFGLWFVFDLIFTVGYVLHAVRLVGLLARNGITGWNMGWEFGTNTNQWVVDCVSWDSQNCWDIKRNWILFILRWVGIQSLGLF